MSQYRRKDNILGRIFGLRSKRARFQPVDILDGPSGHATISPGTPIRAAGLAQEQDGIDDLDHTAHIQHTHVRPLLFSRSPDDLTIVHIWGETRLLVKEERFYEPSGVLGVGARSSESVCHSVEQDRLRHGHYRVDPVELTNVGISFPVAIFVGTRGPS